MLEYALQIIFLFSVLFVYMLNGSIIYSAIGEGYKATPLRCFAVGVGFWILLVILSTVLLGIKLEYLWWLFVSLTLTGLFILPKQDQQETLDKNFFLQVATSFIILLPVFVFLSQDKLHLWQEFAIYGKGVFSLLEQNYITAEFLTAPISYQLAILPVGYFIDLQDNIFACFNLAIFAFVACEFVRNSGVKIQVGNIVFPLVTTFALLGALNPFSIKELILSADPFIFVCAIGFAFAEYIFRRGHLPKDLASIAPAIILMLLALSSTQGFLLSCSLFLVLLLRYIIQFSKLTVKQVTGLAIIPLLPTFVILLWQFYLNQKGLGFLIIDLSQLTLQNMTLMYKAMLILAKQHIWEVCYIGVVLLLGLVSLTKVKKVDDLIIDKYVLRATFWIVLLYIFICVPIFFSQYDSVARASYSLGFTTIALIQFIILMPIGRLIKETLDKMGLSVAKEVKATVILALIITFVMNKEILYKQQNIKIENMQQISQFIQKNLEKNSHIALIDIKKTGRLYQYILSYQNMRNIKVSLYSSNNLEKSLELNHKMLIDKKIDYVLMHAPNNLLVKNFEYNFNPYFSYLYKVKKDGLHLLKKFEHKQYKDTNILF